jgi:hypothetical protein
VAHDIRRWEMTARGWGRGRAPSTSVIRSEAEPRAPSAVDVLKQQLALLPYAEQVKRLQPPLPLAPASDPLAQSGQPSITAHVSVEPLGRVGVKPPSTDPQVDPQVEAGEPVSDYTADEELMAAFLKSSAGKCNCRWAPSRPTRSREPRRSVSWALPIGVVVATAGPGQHWRKGQQTERSPHGSLLRSARFSRARDT